MGVNKSIPKVDGMGLILGKPVFTDDMAPRDSLIVKVLRSPYAHGKILEIDTHIAEALPGIKCIFTYKNIRDTTFSRAGQGYPEPSPYDHKILNQVVRYIGDPIAVVAGSTEKVVDIAISKIRVKYDLYDSVLEFEDAKDNKTVVHDEDGTSSMFEIGHFPERNIAASYEMEIGSVEDTLRKCDVVYEGRYYTQAQSHSMAEPHTSVAYMDQQDRLNIISSTQTPFHLRRIIGRNLDIPLSRIRVLKPRIGGGYGGKQAIHGEFFTSLVTLKTGLPSKMIYSRKEVFEATYTRHAMRIDMKIGSDKSGNIKAIDMKVLSNTGAYGEHALTVLMVAGAKSLPLYNKVEAVAFSGDVVYTNLTPAGAFRGYGAVQGNFALESSIDELAGLLDMDPVEIRRKNMIREGETSKIFEVMGEGKEGSAMTVESCKLNECLDLCVEKLDYYNPKKRISSDPNKIKGLGIAIAMQGSGIPYIDMGAAVLKLNDDGFFNLLVGATDLGTGSDTILAQIAAETLMVPVESIIVYSSDTDLTPYDTGAYASSTTYISGHSVRIACENMIKDIIKEGKRYFNSDDVTFDGEMIKCEDSSISLKELSTILFYSEDQKQLVSSGSYVGTSSAPPYMVGGAEIEIDKRTGHIDLINYVATVDCGNVINPNLAKIQVEGALVQGLGMTLYEEVNYTELGRNFNNSFLRYNVPTRMEISNMDINFVDSYEPSGPYGAKSVGEIGIDTPPAAIANAIKDALGIRFNRLPIKSEMVWKEIKRM